MNEDLKFKDYVYITYIGVMPFLLLMLSLKFFANEKFIFNDTIFWILIIILSIVFVLSFIISLLYTIEHILNLQYGFVRKSIHLILLFIFNMVYIPFYYGIYMVIEKALGLFMPFVNIGTIVLFFFASNNYILDYFKKLDAKNILVNTNYTYLSKNDLFNIKVTKDYSCNKDMGEYVISCDKEEDDSFLGIYSYSYKDYSMGQLDDIYYFHLEQTKDYIKEADYEYTEELGDKIVVLKYSDMVVLYKGIDCDIDNDGNYDYRLIIIKEVPEHDDVIKEFDELVNSIEFVGTN